MHREPRYLRQRVVIADDHEIFRRALADILASTFEIVGEAREGGEALDKTRATKPDAVALDITMPGMDGIEAARLIRLEMPHVGILVITADDSDERVFEAISAGVNGYVLKDESLETIVDAIRNTAAGRGFLPPAIAKKVMNGMATAANGITPIRPSPLSSRELTVLRLLAEGRRNRQIAADLCISERTVGNHITSIYRKLDIWDRSQAVVYAIKKGIIRI